MRTYTELSKDVVAQRAAQLAKLDIIEEGTDAEGASVEHVTSAVKPRNKRVRVEEENDDWKPASEPKPVTWFLRRDQI
ncbi:hypothetical protein PInf_026930 [Phytophthora infestans]|nr:hypothetical protein PInf_026930 [Phytophthora infestans]